MNYKTLLKLITEMSPEQQEMDVVVSRYDDYVTISMLTEACHVDDSLQDEDDATALTAGQPILS